MMNIFFNCSQKYVKYMTVTIESILNFHPPGEVKFFVFYDDCSPEVLSNVSASIYSKGSSINFIKVDPSYVDFLEPFHGSYATFYKLFSHLLLPYDVERALYLDTDMIVDSNLDDLYYQDFDGNAIIISYDRVAFDNIFLKKIPFTQDESRQLTIANAGMVLFNVKLIRELGIDKKQYQEIASKYPFCLADQGIISRLYCVDLKLAKYVMPFDYNYRITLEEDYSAYANKIGVIPRRAIIHFIGGKPWTFYTDSQSLPYNSKWWEYAKRSIFYLDFLEDIILSKTYLNFQEIETFLRVKSDNVRVDAAMSFFTNAKANTSMYVGISRALLKKQLRNNYFAADCARLAWDLGNLSAGGTLCYALWYIDSELAHKELISVSYAGYLKKDPECSMWYAKALRDGVGTSVDLLESKRIFESIKDIDKKYSKEYNNLMKIINGQ